MQEDLCAFHAVEMQRMSREEALGTRRHTQSLQVRAHQVLFVAPLRAAACMDGQADGQAAVSMQADPRVLQPPAVATAICLPVNAWRVARLGDATLR